MAEKQSSKLATGILSFLAVAYFAFGGWVILDPDGTLSAMFLSWSNSDGKYELLSNYGGINVAVGIFCWLAVCRPALRARALVVPIVLNSGYVLGRIIAFFLIGMPGAFVLGAFAFESIALVLSYVGYRSISLPPD